MTETFPVLLIDDDTLVADLLGRAFSKRFPEASLVPVASFQEAVSHLERLDQEEVRLILLDIDLRDTLTGLDFLRLARSHPKGRVVPVVMLTTNHDPDVVQQAYTMGAAAFTHKPFNYEEWQEYAEILRGYWFNTVTVPELKPPEPKHQWLFRRDS